MRVYLMINGEGHFKIGRTKQKAALRLKQLQTGSATKLELVAECVVKYPSKVEAVLHRRYDHYRLTGEWFALPWDEVEAFVDTASRCDAMISDLVEAGNPFI